jgi:hypothetical protein
MRINVSGILKRTALGATTFTRLRPTTTYAKEGEASNTYASVSLAGIVQPAATTDANLLPEGVRVSDVQAFFTSDDVGVGGPEQLPDILQFGGFSYRVLHVQDFGAHGLRKALAQRFAAGELPPVEEDDGA